MNYSKYLKSILSIFDSALNNSLKIVFWKITSKTVTKYLEQKINLGNVGAHYHEIFQNVLNEIKM